MKLDLLSINHGEEDARVAFINSLVDSVGKRGTALEVPRMGNLESFSVTSCVFNLLNQSMNYAMNLGNHGGQLYKNMTFISEFGENTHVTAYYSHACKSSKNGSFVKFSLVFAQGNVQLEVCSCTYVVHAEMGVYRICQSEKLPGNMLELPSGQRHKIFGVIPSFFDFIEGLVEPNQSEELRLTID